MADETLHRLDGLLRELHPGPPVPLRPDLSLRQELLLDSLDLADLSGLIGREFGIVAPAEAMRTLPSVGALCAFIEARQSSSPGISPGIPPGSAARPPDPREIASPVVLRPARE